MEGKGKPEGKPEGKPPEARQRTGAHPQGMSWGQRMLALCLAVVAGVVASVGLLGVVAAGFSLSFESIAAVAVAARIDPGRSWLMPVSIDGAMLVASVNVVIAQRLGRTPWYPLAVVVTGAGISVACNGLHALGSAHRPLDLGAATRFLVSAIPAVMLALCVHLLVDLLTGVAGRAAASAAPVTGPRRRVAQPRAATKAPGARVDAPEEPPAGQRRDEVGEARRAHQLADLRQWQRLNGRVPPRAEAKRIAKCGSDVADELLKALRDEASEGKASEGKSGEATA